MRIQFSVGGVPAEYHRDPAMGGASLRVGDEKAVLQSMFDPRTHFYFKSNRSWERRFGDHVVRVEKTKPFVAVTGHRYRVYVDGELVAEQEGY